MDRINYFGNEMNGDRLTFKGLSAFSWKYWELYPELNQIQKKFE